VVIVESVGASLLLLGTILILRACWRMDQPPAKVSTRARKARGRRQVAMDKRAA
jgi:hypothetical protein